MAKPKNNAMSEEEFFASVGMNANGLPEEVVRSVYFGMLKNIIEEFRKGREINLPKLGTVYLYPGRNVRIRNIHTGVIETHPRSNEIHFKANYRLNEYIKTLPLFD